MTDEQIKAIEEKRFYFCRQVGIGDLGTAEDEPDGAECGYQPDPDECGYPGECIHDGRPCDVVIYRLVREDAK